MNKQVSTQAVAGAIRATEGIKVSHRYTGKGSRSVRSTGIYTEKLSDGRIKLDYWTDGYKHHAERAQIQLPLVIETLKAKGFDVIEQIESSYMFVTKCLVVVAA